MHVAVLTYDKEHRKTQDLLWRLFLAHINVDVVATPWEQRKARNPLAFHRPMEPGWPCNELPHTPRAYCDVLNFPYRVVPKQDLTRILKPYSAVLIGGAGILSDELVEQTPCLNVHPGYLPNGRGLDALKWALLKDLPVGVTAHICDNQTDAGWLIDQVYVPIYANDTFHSLAMRQYEYEMELFVPALLEFSEAAYKRDSFPRIDVEGHAAYRRMKFKDERALMAKTANKGFA